MSTYSEFEARLLVGAYLLSEETGDEDVSVGDIFSRFDLFAKPNWTMRALIGFVDQGLAVDGLTHDDEMNQSIWLKAAGIREAERLIAAGLVLEAEAPAADRIVKFDHNLPEYLKVVEGISELRESVRADNEIDPDERDRLTASLEAAAGLWQASQIKIIQLKIGVVMAVQDAAKALEKTARAVAASLLVDMVKSFIKARTGVDVDQI